MLYFSDIVNCIFQVKILQVSLVTLPITNNDCHLYLYLTWGAAISYLCDWLIFTITYYLLWFDSTIISKLRKIPLKLFYCKTNWNNDLEKYRRKNLYNSRVARHLHHITHFGSTVTIQRNCDQIVSFLYDNSIIHHSIISTPLEAWTCEDISPLWNQ